MEVRTVKAFSGKSNLDTSSYKFTRMNKTLFPAYSAWVDIFAWLINLDPLGLLLLLLVVVVVLDIFAR